jgi:hypothetical protein
MATLFDPDSPDVPPEWAWPTQPNVTAALMAQLGRLGQLHLDDSVRFVLPHAMLPGVEMVDGIPVVRVCRGRWWRSPRRRDLGAGPLVAAEAADIRIGPAARPEPWRGHVPHQSAQRRSAAWQCAAGAVRDCLTLEAAPFRSA